MTRAKKCILVAEDDDAEREALSRVLRLEKYDVRMARNPAEALTFLDQPIDLVLSDLRMGLGSGIDLLRAWRQRRLDTPFILLTAFGTVDTAVTAMKLGAADFLTKPVDPVKLLDLIASILGRGAGADTGAQVIERINAGLVSSRIVGRSPALVEVCEQTERAAQSASTVLILGESGTGKELIAEALHYSSPRRAEPFVVVNMAAIPEALVESELFGHLKGAFTSALANRVGRFEAARGGTLFIDEIGDFPLAVQAKLLRVLETRKFHPVGGDREVLADVRIVAATSRPLQQMVQTGAFREDLYYRLNIIAIHLPPLRQRRQDIPLLTQHFLTLLATEQGRKAPQVAPDLLRQLEACDWPGNIRQLRNCLERIYVLTSSDELTLADLPPEIRQPLPPHAAVPAGSRMESLKRSAILEAIEQFGGNRTRAAQFLGISVRTLQRKLRDWGLAGPSQDAIT